MINFHCLDTFTSRDIGQYVYFNCLLTRFHVINFEINLIYIDNILRTKRDFKMKYKAFFINFQGLSVDRNCLRPETAPLTILPIKRELLCSFAKTLNGPPFYGT